MSESPDVLAKVRKLVHAKPLCLFTPRVWRPGDLPNPRPTGLQKAVLPGSTHSSTRSVTTSYRHSVGESDSSGKTWVGDIYL